MDNDVAVINPKVLAWAVERRGLALHDLAKKTKINEKYIRTWLEGAMAPPFDWAMRLAETLRIPFGVLFLNEPPTIDTPLPDLRRLGNTPLDEPSVNFMDMLHMAMSQHDWFKKHQLEQGAGKVLFVGKYSASA